MSVNKKLEAFRKEVAKKSEVKETEEKKVEKKVRKLSDLSTLMESSRVSGIFNNGKKSSSIQREKKIKKESTFSEEEDKLVSNTKSKSTNTSSEQPKDTKGKVHGPSVSKPKETVSSKKPSDTDTQFPYEKLELAQREVINSGMTNIELADREHILGLEVLQEQEKIIDLLSKIISDK